MPDHDSSVFRAVPPYRPPVGGTIVAAVLAVIALVCLEPDLASGRWFLAAMDAVILVVMAGHVAADVRARRRAQ